MSDPDDPGAYGVPLGVNGEHRPCAGVHCRHPSHAVDGETTRDYPVPGCATIGSIDPALNVPWSESYDARTQALTGIPPLRAHDSRLAGKLESALVRELREQLAGALDHCQEKHRDLDTALAEVTGLLAESVRAGEERDAALRKCLAVLGIARSRPGGEDANYGDAVVLARAALNQAKGRGNG